MPVSVFDDNIYQNANWTRAADPGRQRYQQLGGVSLIKAQNPTYIDQTNANLTTRAVDRRVANPDSNLFASDNQAEEQGASSNAEPQSVESAAKERHVRRRRRRSNCRAPDDDQATLNVCPSDRLSLRDFVSEMTDTCTDVSMAVSKRKDENLVDSVSDAVYKGKRPLYLGIIMLILLLLLILVLVCCSKPSMK